MTSHPPIPFARPKPDPQAYQKIYEILDTGILTDGAYVDELEQHFSSLTGTKFAVATSSCTSALQICSVVAGFQGNQVSIPAMTHVATAHAVSSIGGRPEFHDVESNGIAHLPGPYAVGVRFLGAPLPPPPKHQTLIEDCAHCPPTNLPHTSLAACYSFFPSKWLPGGEGGMIVTNDPYVARTARELRAFGYTHREPGGKYDVARLGWNARMTEMSAALVLDSMERLPEERANRVKRAERIAGDITPVWFLPPPWKPGFSPYCLNFLHSRRDELISHLLSRGIHPTIHYATPVPLLGYYRELQGHAPGDFPRAEKIARQSVSLPLGPHIGDEECSRMNQALKEFITRWREARDD